MNFKYIKSITTITCFVWLTTFSIRAVYNNGGLDLVISEVSASKVHTVTKGDTVYSIARYYNVSVSDIYAANPNAVDGIRIGDVLTIPSSGSVSNANYQDNSPKTYVVKLKETLYSIAKENGVKVEDIIDANPELKSRPLTEGQILRIPSSQIGTTQPSTNTNKVTSPKTQFVSHKVQPRETLYGISKLYNVTTEAIIDFNPNLKDGLIEGSTIIIPIIEPISGKATLLDDINKISIGVVLPFVNKSNGQSARFVEYYEGFLLALSDMKAKGLSANVYTFDMGSETGTDKLKSLLETYEMKYLDLIIGGVSSEQVSVISDFAKKQGIKYVIPFPTKNGEVKNNSEIFQVNTPHSVLYANVAKTFTSLFSNANVIYITEPGSRGDRVDFINELNSQLPRAGMIASSVEANENLSKNLGNKLDTGRKNIIIPTSSSAKILNILLAALKPIKEEQPSVNLSLFGHTDWQTYSQYIKDYAQYDTYIYAPFYMNDDDYRVRQFVSSYKKWYNNKNMINTYPRYGMLGYDTGISFLSALQKSGKNFESNLNSLAVSSLQTPFLFKKESPSGGYLNTGFYIVHYNKDGSIDKTEYGR